MADRDRALERLHQNAQVDVSRLLFDALDHVDGFLSKLGIREQIDIYHMNALVAQFEMYLRAEFGNLFPKIVARIKRMRHAVFVLTYASELEAIGQATQRKVDTEHHEFKLKISAAKDALTITDQSLEKKIWLSLSKLTSKLVQAFSIAIAQELPAQEVIQRVTDAFPKIENYKRPPRELKPIREADTPRKKDFMDLDFIDEGDWNMAVDAYKDTELPTSRFDRYAQVDPDATYSRYNWEVEQDLTDDFVNQVRDGQVDAANDLGIKDFVWVAILDDHTDECCSKRNGHTSSEIQTMLASGDLDADMCDAVVAPAHPNCRCQMSPVASVDEVQGPDWNSFNDWLES